MDQAKRTKKKIEIICSRWTGVSNYVQSLLLSTWYRNNEAKKIYVKNCIQLSKIFYCTWIFTKQKTSRREGMTLVRTHFAFFFKKTIKEFYSSSYKGLINMITNEVKQCILSS